MGFASLLLLPWVGLGVSNLRPSPPTSSTTLIAPLDPQLLRGEEIELPLPDGAISAVRDDLFPLGPESFAWVGHLRGDGAGTTAIVLSVNREVLFGSVRTPRRQFRIRPSGAGLYRIEAVSDDEPSERLPLIAPPRGDDGRPETAQLAADDGSTLDLLVLYTPRARRAAGGSTAIASLVQLGVQETNLALAESAVATRVRLVHLQELPYVESGRIQSDLEILRLEHDGSLDEAQTLRDRYGADLVQLVVAENDGCGISYAMGKPSSSFAEWAYSVVEWSCVDWSFATAHELGHNLGCDHAPEDPTSGGAFAYSFGYKDLLAGFRTIMAYGPGRRVPRFSNPRLTLGGLLTGGEQQDNARTVNETRRTAARFRPGLPPPRITFSSRPGELTASLLVSPNEPPVVEWRLWLGTQPGAKDAFDSGPLGPREVARLGALPSTEPLLLRVWYRRGPVWLYEDLSFERNP